VKFLVIWKLDLSLLSSHVSAAAVRSAGPSAGRLMPREAAGHQTT
jgi:hypothetical protein